MHRFIQRIVLILIATAVLGWIASYFLWLHVGIPLSGNNAFAACHQVRGHIELKLFTHYPNTSLTGVGLYSLDSIEAKTGPIELLYPPMFTFEHIDLAPHQAARVANDRRLVWLSALAASRRARCLAFVELDSAQAENRRHMYIVRLRPARQPGVSIVSGMRGGETSELERPLRTGNNPDRSADDQ